MASIGIPRRTLLGWGASLIALETATSRAAAREPELFGLKLPGEVSRLLPSEAIDAIGIVETLIRLERAADDAKLPATPLRFDGDLSPAALAGSLYRSLMPRLVALIDRSQRIDPKLADQAGALLAQLHGAEHEIPDLLRGFAPGSDQQLDGDGNGPLSLAPPTFDNVGDNASDVVAPGRRTLWASAAPPVAKKPAPPPLSRARKYPALKDEYRRLFDEMTLRPNYSASTDWYLTMLKTSRPSYDRVALDTGVPWFVIGIIHGLEASFNFLAHLHNGDHPLTGRTRKVPAGRPLTGRRRPIGTGAPRMRSNCWASPARPTGTSNASRFASKPITALAIATPRCRRPICGAFPTIMRPANLSPTDASTPRQSRSNAAPR